MIFARRLVSLCLLLAITACASHQGSQRSSRTEPVYKVGQPYEISGNWYYPKEDYNYDETGIASYYGSDFHEKRTANGEMFNMNELTAAHKTLPLPTLARVTNLDNGRSIVVRINDRGPFSGARIIDVSQRAAQLLGFEQQGTAKVRVQVLADESKAIADAMRSYGSNTTVASAEPMSPRQSTNAAVQSVETKTLEPIKTTPAIHQQLLETKPVAEAVIVPVTGSHQIYVQAGAFTVEDNAIKLQKTLSSLGRTSVAQATVNGRQFYRVRVGPLTNVEQADAMILKVKKAGIASPRTVVE